MNTIREGKEHTLEIKSISGQDEEGLGEVKRLFLEYAQSLDIDLSFQDFEGEFKSLPGKYGAPDGDLLVAFVDGKAAGCIALRKISEGICEMKRLYVRDAYRGFRIGKILVTAMLDRATELGYEFMRLDTLSTMTNAQSLYRSVGFYDIEPYVFNPIAGTRFLELALTKR